MLCWKLLLEAMCCLLAKHEPTASHGEPIRVHFHGFPTLRKWPCLFFLAYVGFPRERGGLMAPTSSSKHEQSNYLEPGSTGRNDGLSRRPRSSRTAIGTVEPNRIWSEPSRTVNHPNKNYLQIGLLRLKEKVQHRKTVPLQVRHV